jgi:hypothetical protein
MTADEVMEILRSLNAGSVAAAGASYGEAASALDSRRAHRAAHPDAVGALGRHRGGRCPRIPAPIP